MESNKKKGIIITTAALTALGLINQNTTENNNNTLEITKTVEKIESKKTCDGITITTNCEVDGIEYSVYKYYEAVPEKSHTETITTYTEEITGYCTKCNDGTWSPTCATGRGACSNHGGVAQYNAPRYSKVPHYEEKIIIDSEAIPERWEKVIK